MALLLFILIPAIGFGGWPVIARLTGVTAAWMNIILMSVTTVSMLLYYGKTAYHEPISKGQLLGMTGVGLLNSLSLVLFALLMKYYPQYVPIAQALMPITSFVGAWKLLGTPVSTPQAFCMFMACVFIAGAGYFTPQTPAATP